MNRNLYQKENYGFANVGLEFAFTTNSSSDPAMTTLKGVNGTVVKSITHNGTGDYIITLGAQDTFNSVVFAQASVSDDAGATNPLTATVGNFGGLAGAGPVTFHVYTRDNGTKTDMAANVVRVALTFRNTNTGMA